MIHLFYESVCFMESSERLAMFPRFSCTSSCGVVFVSIEGAVSGKSVVPLSTMSSAAIASPVPVMSSTLVSCSGVSFKDSVAETAATCSACAIGSLGGDVFGGVLSAMETWEESGWGVLSAMATWAESGCGDGSFSCGEGCNGEYEDSTGCGG